MSIFHYFGKDPERRAKFIFNLIAPVYGFIDKGLNESFNESAEILNKEISLKGLNILDVRCGTGAWISTLSKYKPRGLTGVDMSKKMLREAKKKHPNINFYLSDAKRLELFTEGQFDLVTASYVLHGTKVEQRTKILEEMKRVSSKYVVIHDFYGKTQAFIRFLEFLERSDYVNFKKNFHNELKSHFHETKIIPSGKGRGLYIGVIP